MFHCYNCVRSTPLSPTVDVGVASYAGCFDLEHGSFSTHPPDVSRQRTAGSSTFASAAAAASEDATTEKRAGVGAGGVRGHPASPLTPTGFKSHFSKHGDEARHEIFSEQHATIHELDRMYAQWKQLDADDWKASQPAAAAAAAAAEAAADATRSGATRPPLPLPAPPSKRRPIRCVFFSDIHQFQEWVKLPAGDVLILGGDILMSDRWNFDYVSRRYLDAIVDWMCNKHHHAAVIVIGGNHDQTLGNMTLSEIRATFKRAKFLAADQVVDCFGLRFFGNSFSFGTSPNKYGQTPEFLDALRHAAPATLPIVNGVSLPNAATAAAAAAAAAAATAASATVVASGGEVAAAAPAAAPLPTALKPRRDPRRAFDILLTHSAMDRRKPADEAIVRVLNPALHLVGHHHERSGLWRGLPRTTDGAQRFTPTAQLAASAAPESAIIELGDDADNDPDVNASDAEERRERRREKQRETVLLRHIPELNGAIVAELHKWHPILQTVKVFDVWPVAAE